MLLQTDRLLIRPWRQEEAHQRIDRYAERSAVPPRGFWAIERAADGVVAGSVLLLTLPNAEADEVEIGWHLHPDSWDRGVVERWYEEPSRLFGLTADQWAAAGAVS